MKLSNELMSSEVIKFFFVFLLYNSLLTISHLLKKEPITRFLTFYHTKI